MKRHVSAENMRPAPQERFAMKIAHNDAAPRHGQGEKLRLLKIFAALLAVVCVETCVYWQYAVPRVKPAGHVAALSPQEALAYIHDTPGLLIVDVRSQKEFADGHLPHAMNMPLYAFHSQVKNIPHGVPILLHCQYGFRALQAYKLFRRLRSDITDVRYAAGQLHFSFLQQEEAAAQ